MRVSLVDVAKRIRDPRPGHLDVAHSEVGMQSLFKTKGSSSRVGCHKFDTELLAESSAKHQTKFGGPPLFRRFVALGGHAYNNYACDIGNRIKRPSFCSYKPVVGRFRIVGFVCKPRETYWYASTDGMTVFPTRLPAEKEHFFFACRPP